jgi:hypothetical protein
MVVDIYTYIIIFTTLSIITGIFLPLYFFTDIFKNHTPKTLLDPNLSVNITNNVSPNTNPNYNGTCIGPEAEYTLYNKLDLNKEVLLKSCEGIVSRDGNVKFLLDSNGVFRQYMNGEIKFSSATEPGIFPWKLKRKDNVLYPGIYDNNDKFSGQSTHGVYHLKDAGQRYVQLSDKGTFQPYIGYTTIVPLTIDLSTKENISRVFNYKNKTFTITDSVDFEPTGELDLILESVNPVLLIEYCTKTVINLLYGDIIPNDIPTDISLRFTSKPIINAMAYAIGNGIEYNISALLATYNNMGKDITKIKNEMIGVMMHEITHVFQYGKYTNQLYVEGIAEYVRMKSSFVEGWPEEKENGSSTFNVPYGGVPAYFLVWLNKMYPGIIKKLNLSFRDTFDVSSVISKVTNSSYNTIDELWLEYQKTLK